MVDGNTKDGNLGRVSLELECPLAGKTNLKFQWRRPSRFFTFELVLTTEISSLQQIGELLADCYMDEVISDAEFVQKI